MRRLSLFSVPIFLTAVAMGCQPPVQELTSLRTAEEIQADAETMRATWVDLANVANAAGVAALYTDDALYVDPYGGVHQGRAAVEESHEQTLARSSDWDLQIEGLVIQGDMVATYGTWSATQTTAEGDMLIVGRWQNVVVYQPDGSPKIRLSFAMLPALPPEM